MPSAKIVSEEFSRPQEDTLKIAVISDTHSQAHPRALESVAALDPDLILHAGDIGELAVVEPFRKLAPTYVVRGNIDDKGVEPDVRVLDLRCRDYHIRVLLTHIALYGPRLRKDARLLAHKHGAHLIVCGHSHVPFLGQEGKIVVFNPGSIGPKRMHLPIVFGFLELGRGSSRIEHRECESGQPWLPPG